MCALAARGGGAQLREFQRRLHEFRAKRLERRVVAKLLSDPREFAVAHVIRVAAPPQRVAQLPVRRACARGRGTAPSEAPAASGQAP